jgi:hypothetical protein
MLVSLTLVPTHFTDSGKHSSLRNAPRCKFTVRHPAADSVAAAPTRPTLAPFTFTPPSHVFIYVQVNVFIEVVYDFYLPIY